MATITISHDPGLVAMLADRVIILSGGLIVEDGPASSVFTNSKHPYTLDLLGSTRRYNTKLQTFLPAENGFSLLRMKKPDQCPYNHRCQFAFDRCKKENPVLIKVGVDHQVACWMDIMNGKAR
jgi:oligopeptide/dipeptide ABC transporter ATP-binding protein